MQLHFKLSLVIIGVLSLVNQPVEGGTVLKWSEMSRENGKVSQSTVKAYCSNLGVKAEMNSMETAKNEMTVLYLKNSNTVYITIGSNPEALIITNDIIAALKQKIHETGSLKEPENITVAEEEADNPNNAFKCKTFSLKQTNTPTRFVCLADPATIGIDAVTNENLRQLFTLMKSFMGMAEQLSSNKKNSERKIRFNTYDMKQGFPVREWEPLQGVNSMDSQLVSVTQEDIPPALFQIPVIAENKQPN